MKTDDVGYASGLIASVHVGLLHDRHPAMRCGLTLFVAAGAFTVTVVAQTNAQTGAALGLELRAQAPRDTPFTAQLSAQDYPAEAMTNAVRAFVDFWLQRSEAYWRQS